MSHFTIISLGINAPCQDGAELVFYVVLEWRSCWGGGKLASLCWTLKYLNIVLDVKLKIL